MRKIKKCRVYYIPVRRSFEQSPFITIDGFSKHKQKTNDFPVSQVSSVRSGLYQDRKVFGTQTKNRLNSEHEQPGRKRRKYLWKFSNLSSIYGGH